MSLDLICFEIPTETIPHVLQPFRFPTMPVLLVLKAFSNPLT